MAAAPARIGTLTASLRNLRRAIATGGTFIRATTLGPHRVQCSAEPPNPC